MMYEKPIRATFADRSGPEDSPATDRWRDGTLDTRSTTYGDRPRVLKGAGVPFTRRDNF